jgi:hypothetical protein
MIRFPLSIRGVGGFLVVVGLVSCVLHLVGFNLRILLWVDLWGPAMGWLIRLGVVAIGAALVLLPMILGRKDPAAAGEQPQPAPGYPPPAYSPPGGAPGFAGQPQPGYPRAPGYPPPGAPGFAPQPQPGYPPPPATPPSSPPDGPPPVVADQPGYPPPGASGFGPQPQPGYPAPGAPAYPPPAAPGFAPQPRPGYPPPDETPTVEQAPRKASYSQPAPAASTPARAPAAPARPAPPPAAAAPRPPAPARSAQPQVPKTPLGAARPAVAKRTVFGHAGMAPGAAPRTPLTTVEDDDPFAGGDEGATEMSAPPEGMT